MSNNIEKNFIYADPTKYYSENKILLNTLGTKRDLEKHKINFEEGREYWFWVDNEKEDPLVFPGTVSFDGKLNEWIATIEQNKMKPLSKSDFATIFTAKDIENT